MTDKMNHGEVVREDTLSDLLPPSATPLERTIAMANARISEIEIPIRDLWNPQTCPVALLPWLAWAFSVDHWRSEWPESQKRQAIADSIATHRIKGTPGAVEQALQLLGTAAEVVEWFESGGTPGTFELRIDANQTLANTPLTPDIQQQIRQLADTTKAASRPYVARIAARQESTLGSGSIATPRQKTQISTRTPALALAADGRATGVARVRSLARHQVEF